jgi:hypothetical protein
MKFLAQGRVGVASILWITFAAFAARGATVPTYDVERDFGTNSNPNGVWSYGSAPAIRGPFRALAASGVSSSDDGVPLQYWRLPDSFPAFLHNATTNTAHQTDPPVTWAPGTLVVYPGADSDTAYAVTRLTPLGSTSGVYRVEATVESSLEDLASASDFHLLVNGLEAFGRVLLGPGRTGVTNTVFLNAGTTLDFVIGSGADGSADYSALKLSAKLFFVSKALPVPTISRQPQSVSARVTSNAVFSVTGAPLPLTYQWRRNGVALPGETNQVLMLTNLAGSQAGGYTVVLSNAAGRVISSTATLTVDQKPRILSQPQPARLPAGWNAHLDVEADGPDLRYQWRRNGVAISGATNSHMIRSNLTTAMAGTYTVVVLNSFGSVVSAAAAMTVTTGAAFDVERDFSTNSNPNFAWSYGVHDYGYPYSYAFYLTSLRTNLTAANGRILQAWLSEFSTPAPLVLHNATALNATYPGPITYAPGTVAIFPERQPDSGYTTVRLTLPPGGPGIYQVVARVQSHIDGPSAGDCDFQVRVNEELVWSQLIIGPGTGGVTNAFSLSEGDTVDLSIDRGPDYNPTNDGLKLYATLTEWTNGITNPVITNQPVDFQVRLDQPATFSVSALGTPVLRYQWRRNGSALAQGTNAVLTLPAVQPGDDGEYQVVVSNNAGAVTSAVARLTIDYSPLVTQQPYSLNLRYGQNAAFGVQAEGRSPFYYQWLHEGTPLPNATNLTLSVLGVTLAEAGSYSVIVSNAYGAVTNLVATIQVDANPYFLQQPASKSARYGATVTFFALAEGPPPLRYQWRLNGVDLPGATSPELILTNVQPGQAGDYTLRVSNNFATVLSAPVRLTVVTDAISDVRRDFALGSNPNGVWSYGWLAPAPDTLFFLVPSAGSLRSSNGVSLEFWRMAKPPFLIDAYYRPAFYHNATALLANNGGPSSYEPDALVFFPGANVETSRSTVRFTVPEGGRGTYHLEMLGRPHSDGAAFGDLEFQILQGGGALFSQSLPDTNTVAYTNDLHLAASETLDFVISSPRNGYEEPVGLNLQATLRWTPELPRVAPVLQTSLEDGLLVIRFRGETNQSYVLARSSGLEGSPTFFFSLDAPVLTNGLYEFRVTATNSPRTFFRVYSP